MFRTHRLFKAFVSFSLLCCSGIVSSEMQSLSDSELSELQGQGIGLVMEDFVFSHGHAPSDDKVFRISGVTDSAGNPVTVNVNQLYIARSGSNYGANLEGVNLGRLTNPYEIDLIDGASIGLDGEAVLQFSAPTKVASTDGYHCTNPSLGVGSGECSSRPSTGAWLNGERPDLGVELEINVPSQAPRDLNFHAKSAVFDGSYLRLWGDETQNKMAAEFRLNFYTPELEISTCSQANQGCSSSVKMKDFALELALGHTFQPLYIGADAISGGLTIEIAKITHEYMSNINPATGQSDGSPQGDQAYAFFNDYYSNSAYRSSVSFSEMDFGGVNLGSSRVDGILIQYMDIKFRDLP